MTNLPGAYATGFSILASILIAGHACALYRSGGEISWEVVVHGIAAAIAGAVWMLLLLLENRPRS